MPAKDVIPAYDALIRRASSPGRRDLKGIDIEDKLIAVIASSRLFLESLIRAPLVSKIVGKEYFMFVGNDGKKTSRAVNSALYLDTFDAGQLRCALSCQTDCLGSEVLTKIVYTAAISYCCAADLLKQGDQKTPGTFFEVLIGHIVAVALDVNPEQQIRVPTLDMDITIPTDYVFDLGPLKNRIHLPIKISTRERVVQVWAHQRVLDGMHGVARFKGILIAMAETNKQKETSVVEVCLPNQWIAYQMYIAQMFRVYYLDLPQQYLRLKDRYPFIQVKPFGDFYEEIAKIEGNDVL